MSAILIKGGISKEINGKLQCSSNSATLTLFKMKALLHILWIPPPPKEHDIFLLFLLFLSPLCISDLQITLGMQLWALQAVVGFPVFHTV